MLSAAILGSDFATVRRWQHLASGVTGRKFGERRACSGSLCRQPDYDWLTPGGLWATQISIESIVGMLSCFNPRLRMGGDNGPVGRKNAVRGNFGVSLRDNTDPTTPGLWYSTLEGRYEPCLERQSLPPDYGWAVSGRLVATQISLESME